MLFCSPELNSESSVKCPFQHVLSSHPLYILMCARVMGGGGGRFGPIVPDGNVSCENVMNLCLQ